MTVYWDHLGQIELLEWNAQYSCLGSSSATVQQLLELKTDQTERERERAGERERERERGGGGEKRVGAGREREGKREGKKRAMQTY